MLIYNYDAITKEYIGYSNAELDPEETKVQGKDVYLIPANATLKEPPNVKKNQIQVFRNDWYIEPDFRGQYMVDDEMQPTEVKDIGDLPLGYALITEKQIELLSKKGTNYFIIQNGKLIVNPNYEQEEEQKERERINNLHMTRGDMFEALILAKGITKEQIKTLIENIEGITDIERLLYLNRFNEALDFYRGYPAVDLIGEVLGISSKQLDVFFETKKWEALIN